MKQNPAILKGKQQLDQSLYFFQVTLNQHSGQLEMFSGMENELKAHEKDNLIALSHRLHRLVMDEIEHNGPKIN